MSSPWRRVTVLLPSAPIALIAAVAAACAGATPGDSDAGPGTADAAVVDAAPDSDGGVADAAIADDAGPPPDASPPDPRPERGMSWPASQQFPTFARVEALDVTTAVDRAPDVATMLVTLQGVVNRTVPRIYVPHGGWADELWLDEMAVPTTVVADPLALVAKYRAELAGIVIYDDAQPDTINLATTIAGTTGAIVASPALSAILAAQPYALAIVADLRVHRFGSRLAVYQHQLDHHGNDTSTRMIIGLTPGIPGNLRDYAVATRAMTVWLNPGVAAERALLDRFLARLSVNSPYMGWWPDEGAGVNIAAQHGVPVYAADWSRNLTVLGGSPRGSAPVRPPPPPPALDNKMYVSIFMSDGDNLQECQGLIPLKWRNDRRGAVPIGWTISPALVDVAPLILRYFQRTATDHDVLVAGPSGLGYTYPARWPVGTFADYARQSGAYMAAAGLRVITVWNDRVELGDGDAGLYLDHVPGLLGMTIQDTAHARRMIGGRVPLARMDLSYGDTAAIVWSGVDDGLRRYTGAEPLFVAVQGNMNMGTIHPGAFHEVQERYAMNTNIVFVRPDHFFQLMRAHASPAGHRLLDGDWNGDGKDDILVHDGRSNGWRIGESDGASLHWRSAGTGSGVSAVLDGKHRVIIGDFDGGGTSDVMVYNSGDGSWRLGASDGTALSWRLVNTSGGFGNLLDGAHAIYDGDWNGDGKRDLLFYYNGDGSWWMGLSSGTALTWHGAGNSGGFGNLMDRSHRIVVGDWNGDGRSDVGFHYGGHHNWWLGLSDGNAFTWTGAGESDASVDVLDLRHRLIVGDHDGDGRSDIIAYDSGSGRWTVGTSDGARLTWQTLDNSQRFGNLIDPSRRLTFGDHDGDGRTDALFYYRGDGNWWLRRAATGTWSLAGNTRGFGDLLD